MQAAGHDVEVCPEVSDLDGKMAVRLIEMIPIENQ